MTALRGADRVSSIFDDPWQSRFLDLAAVWRETVYCQPLAETETVTMLLPGPTAGTLRVPVKQADDRTFIVAMQEINASVRNAWLAPSFSEH